LEVRERILRRQRTAATTTGVGTAHLEEQRAVAVGDEQLLPAGPLLAADRLVLK